MSLRSHVNRRRTGNTENLVTKRDEVSESAQGFPGRVKRTVLPASDVAASKEQPFTLKEQLSTNTKRVAFGDLSNAASQVEKTVEQPLPVVTTPPPVEWFASLPDYDKQDIADPRFVSEYATAIFSKLWEIQADQVVGDYMTKSQPDLNEKMRGVLVDWLVEVHWKFKLYPESLFLCVNLLDRFLARCPGVPRNQLQLVGVTCLLIAAKYEDIYAPEIKDVVMICDRTYRKEEILAMEVLILNSVAFQITTPSALLFLLRLAKVAQCDERQFYLAQYCLELGLTVYSLWTRYHPAQLASASLFLSNKLLRKSPSWGGVLAEVSGLQEAALKPLAKELCNILQLTSSSAAATAESSTDLQNQPITKAVKKKFSQPKYYSVAKMVL